MPKNFKSFKQSTQPFSTGTSDGEVSPHIQTLLENNRKWVEESKATNPRFMDGFKSPQKPKYLYFGCSDSRVPPNQLLGLGPGELFVHRNVGNLIPGNDLNVLSVLEFAVGHLNVTDIIVTGHYDCGAVRASATRQDLGTLENWLRLIRDVQRLHRNHLELISDKEHKHRTLVELNVVEQCLNIFKVGVVQRKRIEMKQKLIESGLKDPKEIAAQVFPRIHGLVFDPATGLVKNIPVDFEKRIGSLDSIYGLYKDE
eukprot:CAMPEP_0173138472 /NCGR_PEP_ID=MMETSP1105-20130129/3713_1 /TAXON_ID=2985 /ORGANISM="Ochromonas sp., Strain BG-1" /LENGTH=255 /DNA_ID=CAMNT_0014051079 /DNA_START=220 /DNA_END=987 /DNA_ORIENTATION=+